MNEIRIKGRLTSDPIIRYTTGAEPKAVASFTVAVNRRFNKEITDFIRCQAWGKTANTMEKYCKKGQEILVGGELQCSQYTDKEGNKKEDWKVMADWFEFCGSANNTSNAPVQANFQPDVPTITPKVDADTNFVPDNVNLDDDDWPF